MRNWIAALAMLIATSAYAGELDYSQYVRALATRATLLREWLVFLDRYPVVLMPVAWQRPWPIDTAWPPQSGRMGLPGTPNSLIPASCRCFSDISSGRTIS